MTESIYQAYACHNTLALYRKCSEELPKVNAYTPIERYSNGAKILTRAAMPGYIFLPVKDEFPPLLQYLHGARPLVITKKRCFVPLGVLTAIQRTLNDEFEGGRAPGAVVYDFKPGDRVVAFGHDAFDGLVGTFSKYKGGERCRISTVIGYIEIDLKFLSRAE